jgi:hypothetical protein
MSELQADLTGNRLPVVRHPEDPAPMTGWNDPNASGMPEIAGET